eukprot:gene14444-biopygen13442
MKKYEGKEGGRMGKEGRKGKKKKGRRRMNTGKEECRMTAGPWVRGEDDWKEGGAPGRKWLAGKRSPVGSAGRGAPTAVWVPRDPEHAQRVLPFNIARTCASRPIYVLIMAMKTLDTEFYEDQLQFMHFSLAGKTPDPRIR